MEAPKGNYHTPQPEHPVLRIDFTKATVAEMGLILNALGIGMTREWAEENNLAHLIATDGE